MFCTKKVKDKESDKTSIGAVTVSGSLCLGHGMWKGRPNLLPSTINKASISTGKLLSGCGEFARP